MISRRRVLLGLSSAAGGGFLARGSAQAQPVLSPTNLRGAIDARTAGVSGVGGLDQTRRLQDLIHQAAAGNQWVFLPPGRYEVTGLRLPDRTRLTGIAGATTLALAGSGPFIASATGARRIELAGIDFDGAGLTLPDDVPALLHLRDVPELTIENCAFTGCGKTALQLERCSGAVGGNRMSGIGEYGLYAIDSTGLSVTGNSLADCGNGGILIHRREKGEDGSIISGNRIARTGASYGGTGQFGNAINLYRADEVSVSGNHITDSAFTAIRANGSSNVRIADNHCLRSGETAIYSEFGFEGAVVTGNLVDGAANGISIANFNEGGRLAVVANNIVRNISPAGPYEHDSVGFGIGIGVEADTVVSGNVIENVPRFAMLLGWGPYLRNVAATGNIVREARIGCAVSVVEEAGSALISGNIFEAMQDGAILGFRWHDRATRDLVDGEGGGFPHLTIQGNRHA
ncbi:TIGR03808 family TAT-translocated repetitive protein [Pseudorhizobium endolithicum]|uniref:TIGR03808 family TAT-translocated repetitive protein n=1 Tax=Pseudorhizobium endolithicum TaxID=1191678 RepID=A0ABN7JFH4_9HYPH|nr:TIGR03808 family TAT-translocated repetitive protein [Pseudorhizobium endolithicum]CAD6421988.1 TIGR03808 family TAT-translocated repetitive protein [Rhizobium sp. Q54]CAD7028291.1 TIGR03808 family TAT-translocated repetitive protein [Pseudorhizobium endolithicum]